MASRRSTVAMDDAEIQAFLREPGLVMTFASIPPSGVPHLVALFYGFCDDERIGILTYASSQKVKNLQRDARFSALVETGNAYSELRGVSMSGTVDLIDDQDFMRALMRRTMPRYPNGPVADDEAGAAKVLARRVAVVLNIERMQSWDHGKLGGTY